MLEAEDNIISIDDIRQQRGKIHSQSVAERNKKFLIDLFDDLVLNVLLYVPAIITFYRRNMDLIEEELPENVVRLDDYRTTPKTVA